MSATEETTARDYEMIYLCITKRAGDELRRVAAEKGRTVEDLAQCAVEDACIMSERDKPRDKPECPHAVSCRQGTCECVCASRGR